MNINQQLEMLLNVEPAEPRGWFRWLHNHFLGRYGDRYTGLLFSDLYQGVWQELQDHPDYLTGPHVRKDLLLEILNRHAWMAGMIPLTDLVVAHWDRLDRTARGLFCAGWSERSGDHAMDFLGDKLSEVDLRSDAFCQLACNAVMWWRTDFLNELLKLDADLTVEIRRFSELKGSAIDEAPFLEQVSHRIIDMILEAALIHGNTKAAEAALQHGANPDTPIWQLERSYNEKHTPLSYAISEDNRKMAELLLQYGASPCGTAFAGTGFELFQALQHNWYDLAERLVELGTPLSLSKNTESLTQGIITAGSEYKVQLPESLFFGHFKEELDWVQERIAPLIPLVPIREKTIYHWAHAQGCTYTTIMNKVIGSVERLKYFEANGLDTRLTAEEFLTAVGNNALEGLCYLLSKYGDEARDQVLSAIRERNPEFGKFRQK